MRTPTIVLVHGCGTDAHFWDELLPHLGGVDAVAGSLPGRLDTGGEPCSTAAHAARWLCDWMRVRSIDAAIVVGHSFGGAVAIEAALDPGDARIAGLGLVATGARLRVLPAILQAARDAVRTGSPADLSRWAYRPDTDPALVRRVEAKARRVPVATTAADWLACNAFDRMGRLDELDQRTLVVTGIDDALTPPKYARYLVDHITNAELELVADAGHMLPVERPAVLAAALRRFAATFEA